LIAELTTSKRTTENTETPFVSNNVLMSAAGLTKAFGGQQILSSVDLKLNEGEVVLLKGENGSGKTTLLNILTGNLEPDSGEIFYSADATPRCFRFPRTWWRKLNPFDHFTPESVAQEGIIRTWQDVRLFGTQTLIDNIAIAEPRHSGENPFKALLLPGRSEREEIEINETAEKLLADLGLKGREWSLADRISLGQSKRVAIARAVAAGSKILFLDEPLAGLDRRGVADVLDLLQALVRTHAVTMVIVEHVFNQFHLQHLITTDWLLSNGKLSVSHPQAEVSAVAQTTTRPTWTAMLATDDSEIVDETLPRGALLTRIRRSDNTPASPLLEIKNLVVKRGARTVLGLDKDGDSTGLNLSLYEGETVILQAPNGWGKSTLLAAIAGLIPIAKGEIRLDGVAIQSLTTWDRVRQGLRVLASELNTFPSLKVKEVMKLAGTPKNIPEISTLVDRTCSSLSGGERQRVALFSILPGRVGIYDEPFSALDMSNTVKAVELGKPRKGQTQLILIPGQSKA
jgi:ABC-type branched-subunit amino acid transport system ATPase component